MNRNALAAMATSALAAAALLAVAVIASTPAYAEDITMEPQPFTSSRTRESVLAELKTPYAQGSPWSGLYNMFQARSAASSEQVRGEYLADRDMVAATCGEDSGSMYTKARSVASGTGSAMGASR